MPVSWLDIAGTYVGPGSYNYNVAGYPGGAQLFVNSLTGTDNRGRVTFTSTAATSPSTQPNSAQGPYGDPNKPLATVFGANGALSFCKAGRGDTIIVAPGHAENLASGAAVTIPSGVSIIGGGYGALRPTFSYTNAASFLTGGGAGVFLNNLIFDGTQVASLTKMFLVNTGGFQIVGCRCIEASAINQATDCVVLNAGGDDFLFANGEIDATAGVSARGISNPAANTINRPVIANSFIHGQFSVGPVSFLSTASSEILIELNTLRQEHSATTFVISIAAGNTLIAMLSYNDMFSGQASAVSQGQFYSNILGNQVASIQNFGVRGGATTSAGTAI